MWPADVRPGMLHAGGPGRPQLVADVNKLVLVHLMSRQSACTLGQVTMCHAAASRVLRCHGRRVVGISQHDRVACVPQVMRVARTQVIRGCT
jgi:hypothetical protein